MLQHEFEALTGMKVEEDFYNKVIDPMYMATYMDKQPFCAEFKKNDLGKCQAALDMMEKYYQAMRELTQLKRERSYTVDFLLQQGDTKCDKKAIALVGHKNVIQRKMEHGIELTDEDKDFIKNELCS